MWIFSHRTFSKWICSKRILNHEHCRRVFTLKMFVPFDSLIFGMGLLSFCSRPTCVVDIFGMWAGNIFFFIWLINIEYRMVCGIFDFCLLTSTRMLIRINYYLDEKKDTSNGWNGIRIVSNKWIAGVDPVFETFRPLRPQTSRYHTLMCSHPSFQCHVDLYDVQMKS